MTEPAGVSITTRHRKLRELLAGLELDLFLVSTLPNVFYLSGFKSSAGLLLIGPHRATLIADGRYKTAAAAHIERTGLREIELEIVEHTYEQTLVDVLQRSGGRRVGFEAAHMTVSRHQWLAQTLGSTLVPTEALVEQMRAIKDEAELATLREGARRITASFAPILEEIRPGRREDEVAASVERHLREAGFCRPAFPTIVASGPNTAFPHAGAGDRMLRPGDLVMLDFGGVYDEYCVDLTRMISLGSPDARAKETYGAVRAAQAAAIACVRPGVAAHAVDAAARASLETRGFGEAFPHGTGHGLGIEVHESPRISRPPQDGSPQPAVLTSVVTLTANMVFTIEPGVYFPGWGGMRLEDDVVVTSAGCEVLTNLLRELIER